MKCLDCDACKHGFFKSKPEEYVCTGVKKPFVIEDINHQCTEYSDKNDEYHKISAVLANQKEWVNHPAHYGGENNPYETIKVIEAWEMDFNLGTTLRYISRCGKKDLKGDVIKSTIEDLRKASWYLNREISTFERELESVGYQD